MKNLSTSQMAEINGQGFWDGFCQGAGVAAYVVSLTATGVGAVVGGVVIAGCFTYWVATS